MSKGLQWILGLSAVLVALALVAATILPFFFPQTGWGGYGMMGPGHMYGGGSMMGGLGMFGIGMVLVPLLFVGLIGVGIVWLVKSVSAPASPQPPVAASVREVCIHCAKPLQAGWKACPYCGEKVP